MTFWNASHQDWQYCSMPARACSAEELQIIVHLAPQQKIGEGQFSTKDTITWELSQAPALTAKMDREELSPPQASERKSSPISLDSQAPPRSELPGTSQKSDKASKKSKHNNHIALASEPPHPGNSLWLLERRPLHLRVTSFSWLGFGLKVPGHF